MYRHTKYTVGFVALALMTLLISACSQPTLPTGGNAGSAGTSNLTPLQVLQNSANAMKQLKSAHVQLQSTNNIQTTAAAGTSATPTPTTINATLSGSGDEALPDQEQLKLTINQNTNVAEIVQGNKVYVQNAQGQWYVLDKSTFQGIVGNPFSGITIDQNSLLGLIQHTQITDHGTQALNGENLRHITAVLDKEGLRQLLQNNPQLQGSFGQQNIDTLLNNTKSFQSSVDVWIDETQFYVHRTELKLKIIADTSAVGGTPAAGITLPAGVVTNLDTTVDLSKFNAPVTITPPSNAIPTSDPATILGLGGQ